MLHREQITEISYVSKTWAKLWLVGSLLREVKRDSYARYV